MLRRSLGFDLRSLALLRILAPAAYLLELLNNWQYLDAFYTDSGFLPRQIVFDSQETVWSVYLGVGNLLGVRCLYLVHIAAVLALIVGWRTRAASLVCYVLATSLQNRFNALPGWEAEMRVLFLLGVFLPWGECLSLKRPSLRAEHVCSAATVAWRLQILALYVTSGLVKIGPGWEDGTAVEVSLASDAYSTPLGTWVLGQAIHTPYLTGLSYAVPLLEIFLPLLLFFPFVEIQLLGALGLAALHLGFGLCLHIGMFSPICIACLVCFLPGWVWRRPVPVPPEGEEAPAPGLRRPSLVASVFLGWVSLSILASSFLSLPETRQWLPRQARWPWLSLGLEQHWNMFVPPPFEGGWHVIRGRTRGGQSVDLLRDRREVSEEKPAWVWELYPGVRGYLFLAGELRSTRPELRFVQEAIADCYRRRWENRHPAAEDRLERVEILYFRRKYAPGKGFGAAERVPICDKSY